ncbi:hypothetical protein P8452_06909 [Trifolium repens]|nr:hypothetical protein P8452_06909 [Trifolium repens]
MQTISYDTCVTFFYCSSHSLSHLHILSLLHVLSSSHSITHLSLSLVLTLFLRFPHSHEAPIAAALSSRNHPHHRTWEQLESNGVVISKYQYGQQELQVHADSKTHHDRYLFNCNKRRFESTKNRGAERNLEQLLISKQTLVELGSRAGALKDEEIEMLLENYLQRCESCHCQAERLLDSAREMENTIFVRLWLSFIM